MMPIEFIIKNDFDNENFYCNEKDDILLRKKIKKHLKNEDFRKTIVAIRTNLDKIRNNNTLDFNKIQNHVQKCKDLARLVLIIKQKHGIKNNFRDMARLESAIYNKVNDLNVQTNKLLKYCENGTLSKKLEKRNNLKIIRK